MLKAQTMAVHAVVTLQLNSKKSNSCILILVKHIQPLVQKTDMITPHSDERHTKKVDFPVFEEFIFLLLQPVLFWLAPLYS